jgi:hypothetical protein
MGKMGHEITLYETKMRKKNSTKRKTKRAPIPRKLNEAVVANLVKAIAMGMTESEAAEVLDISRQSIFNWKKKYPTIFYAIGQAKEVADGLIEASLFHRAIGYSHPEERVFLQGGRVVKVQTTKHYPPSVAAIQMWLHNRKSETWQPRRHIPPVEVSEPVTVDDDDPWVLKEIC